MYIICGISLIFLIETFMCFSNESLLQDVSISCRFASRKAETCYYTKVENDAPMVDNRRIRIKEHDVFFIDTSCTGGLDARQECAVEAAARTHPDRRILVLFVGPYVQPSNLSLTYKNVYIYRLNVSRLTSKTPLIIFQKDQIQCLIHRLPEVIKFLVLYNYGGVFLDFNIIMTRSIDYLKEFKNFAGRIDNKLVGAGILGLSKKGIGHIIGELALRRYKHNYMTNKWKQNSTTVLTKVLKSVCSPAKVNQMSADVCGEFEVYDPVNFYPVHHRSWKYYYVYSYEKIPPDPFAFFVWHSSTYPEHVFMDSVYGRLIKNSCPSNVRLADELNEMFYTTVPTGVKLMEEDSPDDEAVMQNEAVIIDK